MPCCQTFHRYYYTQASCNGYLPFPSILQTSFQYETKKTTTVTYFVDFPELYLFFYGKLPVLSDRTPRNFIADSSVILLVKIFGNSSKYRFSLLSRRWATSHVRILL